MKRPIAITLDSRVARMMDDIEELLRLIDDSDDLGGADRDELDRRSEEMRGRLIELRRAWLAEETARAR